MRPVTDNPSPEPVTMIWFEAIARHLCVRASYNGVSAKLAPHILYTRDEQLYLGAVAVERRGARVTERKLGIFKVAGLRDSVLDDEIFATDPGFDRDDSRFAATTVFAVEA